MLPFLRDVLPKSDVLVKIFRIILTAGIPLGLPFADDSKTESDWVNFLSHEFPLLNVLPQ